MNPTTFIQLLNQENISEFKDFKQLDRLLRNHPYFQIGLAAKAKYLKAKQHIYFIKTSRKTAAIFPERLKLYQYINQTEISSVVAVKKTKRHSDHKNALKSDNETQAKSVLRKDIPQLAIKNESIPELEKNYLAEAINQSIQLEATDYTIDESKENENIKDKEVEVLSFSEWLSGHAKISHLEFQNNLIDSFINEAPVITKIQKKEFYSPMEKGKESLSETNLPISETLAQIFAVQGNKAMAIMAYEKLMLKYPEKSAYFAGLKKRLIENKK